MKVTEKDVEYVAELANLELTQQERVGMLRDLNSILDYIDRLNELETSNVVPMTQVSSHDGPARAPDQAATQKDRFADVGREDVPEGLRPSLQHQAALENAPDSNGTFFQVPKVIER